MSTRWCPTREQVTILEDMYERGGVRTPSAAQIQRITAHLSHYGRIEGKNVFYWFQNHKARHRQRLRRRLLSNLYPSHPHALALAHWDHSHRFTPCTHFNHTSHLTLSPPAFPPCNRHHSFNPPCTHLDPQSSVSVGDRAAARGGELENSSMSKSTYKGAPWAATTMEEMGLPSNPNPRPVETLQLFPLAATPSLKEQSIPSSSCNS